jgi:hypothetical protein
MCEGRVGKKWQSSGINERTLSSDIPASNLDNPRARMAGENSILL